MLKSNSFSDGIMEKLGRGKYRVLLVMLVFLWCSNVGFGQEPVINNQHSIKLIDASTLSPIAFGSIVNKRTGKGGITDFYGYYQIEAYTGDSVEVRHVSYNARFIVIGEKQGEFTINLQPRLETLQEVIVKPGEGPSIRILKKVIANNKKYNYENKKFIEYKSRTVTQFFFRRFGDKEPGDKSFMLKKAFKKYGMRLGDSMSIAIPAYSSITQSAVYQKNRPRERKIIIEGRKTNGLGFEDAPFIEQLAYDQLGINFMNNLVPIVDKQFISPISENALLFYKYILMDSVYIDTTWCYEILVKPKREEDLCFTGQMWIAANDYALKQINVQTSIESEINFINRLRIEQVLEKSGDIWVPSSTRLLADAVNIYALATAYNYDYRSNKKHKSDFYIDKSDELATNEEIDEIVMNQLPMSSYDSTILLADSYIDSLKRVGSVNMLAGLVEMSVRGYYNLGKLEMGPYLLLYNRNPVEGNRFRMGFRTRDELTRRAFLYGYGAYGAKDEKFKYKVGAELFIERAKWCKIGTEYVSDIKNLGALDEFYTNNSFLTFASSSGGSDQMIYYTAYRSWLTRDIGSALSVKLLYTYNEQYAASSDYQFAYYDDADRSSTKERLSYNQVGLSTTWHPNTTMGYDNNQRFRLDFSTSPFFDLDYQYSWSYDNIDFHKVSLAYTQRFPIAGFGQMKFKSKGTKILNQAPYPLLEILSGNESVMRTEATYNLMNYGEFIADEVLELYWIWHFDGAILGRIPLIKRLDLRLLADVHAAWGNFNSDINGFYDGNNNGILPPTMDDGTSLTQFGALKWSEPYVEVAYGLENILKFFRLDFIHRLNYHENENVNLFGIKFSGVFRL
ncbi:MAG: DUF5686 and carboxypeptidase regulatory-like domain-containing protein [Bacteroidales bacterium]|nr:DUF5686 and carboxypeptidase regulatory-like domain-containing protein [Bacteroidales bacterium]